LLQNPLPLPARNGVLPHPMHLSSSIEVDENVTSEESLQNILSDDKQENFNDLGILPPCP
jgi:hypothetical protein